MAAINLAAINGSVYIRQEPERTSGSRRIHRFVLENSSSQQVVDSAATAITSLLRDNPQLSFVSRPTEPETLQHKISSCRYLIINGNALCLSNKTKAPSAIDILCKDMFFSEAVIDEPVQCSRGRTFEKRYVEVWAELRENVCPCSNHEIGPIEIDFYLLERINSIMTAHENQARINREATERMQKAEEDRLIQNARITAVKKNFMLIDYSLTLTLSVEPIAQAFYQVTNPKSMCVQRDFIQDLTPTQRLQVFRKVAGEIPISELHEVINRISLYHLNTIMTELGFNNYKNDLLIEKLKLLERNNREITHQAFNGTPGVLESLETAASYFYPDHNPANPWEAQQMINMIAMAAFGVYLLAANTGPLGLAAVGGVIGARAVYKHFSNDLPTEIQPCRNLTLNARAGSFHPLIGRDQVIDQVFQSWVATSATVRQHPLLVGSAGAGKTVIIQEIARRIALFPDEVNIPTSLKEGFVFECTAADLLPGSSFEGAEKFERFLHRVQKIRDRIIIAIDEVHTFMNETYRDRFGELMKSVLDTSTRGLPYMVFATTNNEYEQHIAGNEALARRFHVIRVDLLDKNHTIAVMNQQIRMQFPGLMFDPRILEYVFDRSSGLAQSSSKFKQPEVSKQVLSRAISKIQGELATPPSTKQLNDKKGERELLLSFLSPSTSVNEMEEQTILKIREIDREIRVIEDRVREEKEKLQNYKIIINKTIECINFVMKLSSEKKLAYGQSFSEEQEKQFKFMSYILIPQMISLKRSIERDLKIRSLDQEIVDSVILDIEASL